MERVLLNLSSLGRINGLNGNGNVEGATSCFYPASWLVYPRSWTRCASEYGIGGGKSLHMVMDPSPGERVERLASVWGCHKLKRVSTGESCGLLPLLLLHHHPRLIITSIPSTTALCCIAQMNRLPPLSSTYKCSQDWMEHGKRKPWSPWALCSSNACLHSLKLVEKLLAFQTPSKSPS